MACVRLQPQSPVSVRQVTSHTPMLNTHHCVVFMQEVSANLAMAMDRTFAMAIGVRAECRRLRGDLYGALKDLQELQELGHNIKKVGLYPHNKSIHIRIAPV